MFTIGSMKKEWIDQIAAELKRTREKLRRGDDLNLVRLKEALQSIIPGLSAPYLLLHTPEQGADHYLVLVGPDDLISIVVPSSPEALVVRDGFSRLRTRIRARTSPAAGPRASGAARGGRALDGARR